jgi:Na+-translocating ferredoxin:NAD+ oxidoreductase RnfD subunit
VFGVCPADIPLVQVLREGKSWMREKTERSFFAGRDGCARHDAVHAGMPDLTAAHFSVRYDGWYLPRFLLVVAAGWGIEWLYGVLRDGRSVWPRASTGVTAALLVLSVPARMPLLQVFCGLLVAVLFGKCMVDRQALRLNPMVLGRLFLMIVFAGSIQEWLPSGRGFPPLPRRRRLG